MRRRGVEASHTRARSLASPPSFARFDSSRHRPPFLAGSARPNPSTFGPIPPSTPLRPTKAYSTFVGLASEPTPHTLRLSPLYSTFCLLGRGLQHPARANALTSGTLNDPPSLCFAPSTTERSPSPYLRDALCSLCPCPALGLCPALAACFRPTLSYVLLPLITALLLSFHRARGRTRSCVMKGNSWPFGLADGWAEERLWRPSVDDSPFWRPRRAPAADPLTAIYVSLAQRTSPPDPAPNKRSRTRSLLGYAALGTALVDDDGSGCIRR